jgi:NAD+ diphosphatase
VRPANVFAGRYVDRAAHLRKDPAALAAALADPEARLLLVRESRNLVRRTQRGWTAEFVDARGREASHGPTQDWILLGHFRGRPCFACDTTHHGATDTTSDAADDTSYEDLRRTAGLLPDDEAGLLAYARAMVSWRQRSRHCGTCGSPTWGASAGHVAKCRNEACGAEQFPRLDPAIIVLVTDGERALLGRQAAWPAGRYSTIAGFVEPGESLEDAVAREVLEETGVSVREARYHSSQPWPFPSSLMIGFTATASPEALAQPDEELEDVRWFSREDIAGGFPGLPLPQSVSFRLIEDWYDAGASLPLRSTPGVTLWGRPDR